MTSPSLEYAPKPPMGRRRIVRDCIIVGIWLAIGVFLLRWGPRIGNQVEMLYWQQRCMAYIAPHEQLVFDSSQSIHVVPKEWSNFYSFFSPPGFNSLATIFVHEMKNPSGEKRLVVVDYTPWLFSGNVQLSRVFKPGTAFQRPKEFTKHLELILHDSSEVKKIFAGHIDPSDSSHFSFRAETQTRQMTYDGWLQNDDSVVIGLRESPPSAK